MGKKKIQQIEFGCEKCGYRPDRDESQSNENWNVFKPGKCPNCNSEMKLIFNKDSKK